MEEDKIIAKLHEVITLELAKWRELAVLEVLGRLNVTVSKELKSFYLNFTGPFGQRPYGGELLLDIVSDDPNIESLTKVCREQFDFPDQYLVVTNCSDVGEVTVVDTVSNKVYKVCLECGEDEDLLNGKLAPTWQSFNDFLIDFFDIH